MSESWEELNAIFQARAQARASARAAERERLRSGDAERERQFARAAERKDKLADARAARRERGTPLPPGHPSGPSPARSVASGLLIADATASNAHIAETAHCSTTTVQRERERLEWAGEIHVYRWKGTQHWHMEVCWCGEGTKPD